MQTESNDVPVITSLPNPRMPADRGLSSLGLIMQLGGSVFVAVMAFSAAMILYSGPAADDTWALFVVSALSAVRSSYHRSAGESLVHGPPTRSLKGPLHATRTYVVVAVIHTAICTYLLADKLPDGGSLITMAALLLAWPLTLLVVVQSPAIRAVAKGIPRGDDHGIEGASVLMLLLGVIGTIFAALMLYVLFDLPGRRLYTLSGMAMLGIYGLLLARAILQTVAGSRGISGVEIETATTEAQRYAGFGVISTIIIGALLVCITLEGRPDMGVFIIITAVIYMLLIWPRIVGRFIRERADTAVIRSREAGFRRAPDFGLTSLGWLLLALSVPALVASLSQILFTSQDGATGLIGLSVIRGPNFAQTFGHSQWLAVLLAALQFWAAVELCTMSSRFRLAATVFGLVAAAVTIYMVWPFFQDVTEVKRAFRGGPGGFARMVFLAQVGVSLVIPVGALFLANRRQNIQARARYRHGGDRD